MNDTPNDTHFANDSSAATLSQPMTRRVFLKRAAWLGLGAVGASTLGWSTQIEPRWFEIERVEMLLPNLSPAFDGFTIAQISDIHVSSWMTFERLTHLAKKVNALRPDVVAITGDFLTRRRSGHDAVIASALSTLAPGIDVFAVLGNHDHWTNPKYVRTALKKSGVQELRNSFHTLKRGGEILRICGLDDAWARVADVSRVLQTLPPKGAAILLAHEPDFADDYARAGRFDLQLSGHSHGGQIRAPFIGPLHLPKHGRKYHTAQYLVGGEKPMKLYVNRGVGMVWPYVRFNCRPEITLFTLRAKAI